MKARRVIAGGLIYAWACWCFKPHVRARFVVRHRHRNLWRCQHIGTIIVNGGELAFHRAVTAGSVVMHGGTLNLNGVTLTIEGQLDVHEGLLRSGSKLTINQAS